MNLAGLWKTLFGRRVRKAPTKDRERVWTGATALTVARATVAGVIFVYAIIAGSPTLLLVALSVSMLLDFFDGFLARSMQSETIFGAQLDGLADRLAAAFVITGAISMRGDAATVVVALAVWAQFGLVDQFLTGQFLRFGLWSPDHFYAIDERVWRDNWSPPAKLASNLPILFLALGSWPIWGAFALSLALITLRLRSYPTIRAKATAMIEEKGLAMASGAPGSPRAVPELRAVRDHEELPAAARRVAARS
jgi:hypothetical protein